MNPAIVGTLIRLENRLEVAGVGTDPTSLTFTLKVPGAAALVTYVYPSGVEIVRDSAGVFHVDYIPQTVGTYAYSWDAGGNMEVTDVGFFEAINNDTLTERVPEYMTSADLDRRIGASKVDQLFDDDGDGLRDAVLVNTILVEAEDFAATYMLSAWGIDAINKMAVSDESFRAQVAWVACELASERRTEFLGEDGKGRYWVQMQRAQKYFDLISKGRLSSKAAANIGQSAQEGGRLNPRDPAPPLRRFIWASDRNNRGGGGF